MKKLLILGGSGGIGVALTQELSSSYKVYPLSSLGCDITDIKNLRSLREQSLVGFDYVLNLSAVSIDAVLHKYHDEAIAKQLNVNVLGACNVLKYFIGLWREIEVPGKIILMSSFLSDNPVRGAGIYAASKAFVDSMVKSAAIENAKYKITANSINAGYFDAGLTHRLPKEVINPVKDKIPVGRFGRIEELASAIKFIFENDYVTGSNLVIDGGVSLV
jgi:3-oxoacyl-[acyl-carrier protein] reductase